jgi:hypothetical protein
MNSISHKSRLLLQAALISVPFLTEYLLKEYLLLTRLFGERDTFDLGRFHFDLAEVIPLSFWCTAAAIWTVSTSIGVSTITQLRREKFSKPRLAFVVVTTLSAFSLLYSLSLLVLILSEIHTG